MGLERKKAGFRAVNGKVGINFLDHDHLSA